jgi:hypothetical protein
MIFGKLPVQCFCRGSRVDSVHSFGMFHHPPTTAFETRLDARPQYKRFSSHENPAASPSCGSCRCPPNSTAHILSAPERQLVPKFTSAGGSSRQVLLRCSNRCHPRAMRPLRRRLVRSLCQRLAQRHRPVERRGRTAAVAARVPCDSLFAQELPPTRSWAAGRPARWCFTAAALMATWLFAPMNPASSSPPTCQRRARCVPPPLFAAACFGSGAPGRPRCCRRARQGLGPHTARLYRRVRAATAPSLPRAVVTRLSSVTRRPRSQVLPECRCSGQTAQQLSNQRRRCCPRAPCAAS